MSKSRTSVWDSTVTSEAPEVFSAAIAYDAVFGVEQTIDRLETEVRHPDEVGVGKGERHPQPPGVGLADVADLFGKQGLGLLALLPLVHRGSLECTPDGPGGPAGVGPQDMPS